MGGRARTAAAPSNSETGSERRVVALVRALHGLDGTVRIEVLTDRPEARFGVGALLYREGDERPLIVAAAASVADGPGWRIRFEGRPDRSTVEELRGVYLEAAVEPAADLAADEVYWHEVIGAEVSDEAGVVLGRVRDVYRTGGAEIYIVDGGPPGEFDVPAVAAVIREFAPRDGRIVVDRDALALDEVPAGRQTPDPARLARGIRRRERKAAREAEIEAARLAGLEPAGPTNDPADGDPAAAAGDQSEEPGQ